MPEGRQPRGVTPRPKSGVVAESARLRRRRNGGEEPPKSEVRGSSREELPRVQGQGRRPRGATPRPRSGRVATRGVTPCPRSGAVAGRSYPTPLSQRPRAAAGRSNLTTEARDGGREDQPHVQEAVAAPAQEGLEELSHTEGQEGWR